MVTGDHCLYDHPHQAFTDIIRTSSHAFDMVYCSFFVPFHSLTKFIQNDNKFTIFYSIVSQQTLLYQDTLLFMYN